MFFIIKGDDHKIRVFKFIFFTPLISFRIEPILCAAPQAEHPGTFSRTILSPASETPAKKNSTPITENSTVIFSCLFLF